MQGLGPRSPVSGLATPDWSSVEKSWQRLWEAGRPGGACADAGKSVLDGGSGGVDAEN